MIKNCFCGCGKRLSGQKKMYAQGAACRKRHLVKMMIAGCVPKIKLLFRDCIVCGREYLTLAEARYKTCIQFIPGSKCNGKTVRKTRQPRESKLKGNAYGKLRPSSQQPTKNSRRLPHISTYCIQEVGECVKYSEGFDLEDLDAGCWGKNYTGKCYVRPRLNATNKSMMSGTTHKVNLGSNIRYSNVKG